MPVKIDARGLPRRTVRYRLYRIQSDAAVDSRDGLKSHFESQAEFDGWHNFAKTWDVGQEGEWPEGHFLAVARTTPQDATWNTVLADQATTFGTPEAQTDEVEQHFEEHLEETGRDRVPDNQEVVIGDSTVFPPVRGTSAPDAEGDVAPSADS